MHTPVAGRSARSNIARVPDLPAEALERIIGAIIAQTRAAADEIEMVDLSTLPTLEEQAAALGVEGWAWASGPLRSGGCYVPDS